MHWCDWTTSAAPSIQQGKAVLPAWRCVVDTTGKTHSCCAFHGNPLQIHQWNQSRWASLIHTAVWGCPLHHVWIKPRCLCSHDASHSHICNTEVNYSLHQTATIFIVIPGTSQYENWNKGFVLFSVDTIWFNLQTNRVEMMLRDFCCGSKVPLKLN